MFPRLSIHILVILSLIGRKWAYNRPVIHILLDFFIFARFWLLVYTRRACWILRATPISRKISCKVSHLKFWIIPYRCSSWSIFNPRHKVFKRIQMLGLRMPCMCLVLVIRCKCQKELPQLYYWLSSPFLSYTKHLDNPCESIEKYEKEKLG